MNVRGFDLLKHIVYCDHRLSVCTASVDVESHIIDFRPSVARQMRLADYNYSADSVGGKPIE